jgi:hypothetical protein
VDEKGEEEAEVTGRSHHSVGSKSNTALGETEEAEGTNKENKKERDKRSRMDSVEACSQATI